MKSGIPEDFVADFPAGILQNFGSLPAACYNTWSGDGASPSNRVELGGGEASWQAGSGHPAHLARRSGPGAGPQERFVEERIRYTRRRVKVVDVASGFDDPRGR